MACLKLSIPRKALMFIFLIVVFIIYIFGFVNYIETSSKKKNVTETNYYIVESSKCKIPNFHPFSYEAMSLYQRPVKGLKCSKKPLLTYTVVHDNNETASLFINQKLLSHYSIENHTVICCYACVYKRNDRKEPDAYINYDPCFEFNTSVTLKSDVVKVICRSNNIIVYENVHAVLVLNKSLVNPNGFPKKQPRPISVLFIGLDSMSRLNLIRQMPRTYRYLESNNWLSILGYNKVGENTYPNLMAILTGLNSTAEEEACKSYTIDGLMNCPFIWKEFKKMGYVTAYVEDDAITHTFNLGRKGFKVDPVDYYYRKYFLAVEDLPTKKILNTNFCRGPEFSGQRVLNLAESFSTKYLNLAPTFGFFWMTSFTHNNLNAPSVMDWPILRFLVALNRSGVLDETVVAFFSDHGCRFGTYRLTHSGWYEDRLPMLYLSIPKWFQKKYVKEFQNLKGNRNKLSSGYEFHVTLRHILNLSGGNLKKSSISCPKCKSFFDELPSDRSCDELGIAEHWCTCTNLAKQAYFSEFDTDAAKFIVQHINDYILETFEEDCHIYKLHHIMEVYSQPFPIDQQIKAIIKRVSLATEPYAIFEATLTMNTSPTWKRYELTGDISRLDAYGSKGNCMQKAYLQKYCTCKHKI